MKKIIIPLIIIALGLLTVSCELDLYSKNGYNEFNHQPQDGDTDNPYQTREDILGARNSMYNNIKSNIQEAGYTDWLVYSDILVDNAYSGSPGTPELVALESHTQDGANKNVARDWPYYMNRVNDANQVITYIDDIDDPSLTAAERNQWKAEAMIWRAYNWYRMSQIWGNIPIVDAAPPAITADNIMETYPLYYPACTDRDEVLVRVISDIYKAVQSAPAINSSDKFVCSKAFAYGVLARVYADISPLQNYQKVDSCCTAIEGMGLSLVPDFSTLWSWNADKTDMVGRHSSESIFEVPYTKSSGNWVWMMFWRNGIGSNLDASFDWAKWVTPSRNLIAAFDAQGDAVRKGQSIIYDKCAWSHYYDGSNYPFMYKTRCNASSIILMRLAEIYLLHAEALAHTGNISGAAGYVNQVRLRAKLGELPSSASASKDAMLDAILAERRLELCFEGHRWFDLIRYGKAVECVNNLNNPSSKYYDPKKPVIRTIDERGFYMPIPVTEMDKNPNLVQNEGY